MTFLQIINIIKETALAQPNVNIFVRNFLDLNREDTVYSAVVLQDRDGMRDRISEQDWNTYTFHLGYVDRLTNDESNRDDIFSTGINIINNIVASIRQTWFPDVEVNIIDRFTTFDQRFTASCAGVYVVLSIQVPVSDCVDSEQTDLYDKYEVTFDRNGHYHYVPDGKPVDEIDITIDVEGGGEKPEETLTETIITNGSYHYDPTPGYVFSGADISVNVPTDAVLKKFSTYAPIDKHTGGFFLEPSDIERLGADGLNEVEIEYGVNTLILNPTITTNGSYHYEDPDDYYDYAEITVDVHPSQSLVQTISTNGSHTFTGEWTNAVIAVDVHPSESLSRRYTTNGSKTITGEFNSGTINIDVHPSQSLVETITTNGSHTYTGEWTNADISVDVHPSQSVNLSYSANGSYSIQGEFNGGVVTVAVPSDIKPEEGLVQTISSNGSYHYDPTPGYVFASADISVDVHPSTSLSEVFTSNSVYTIQGEYSGGTVTVDVHPSQSFNVSYSSNGSYSIQGEFNGGVVEVSVPIKTEGSLSETILSNGSYNYTPVQGSVYNSVALSVDVHPSQSLVQTISTNGSHTYTGEWTNATITVAVPTTTTVSMSQSAYDNLSVKDPDTIYLING